MKDALLTILAFAAINAQAVDFKAEIPNVETTAAEAFADQNISESLEAVKTENVGREAYADKVLDALASTIEEDFLNEIEEKFAVRLSAR